MYDVIYKFYLVFGKYESKQIAFITNRNIELTGGLKSIYNLMNEEQDWSTKSLAFQFQRSNKGKLTYFFQSFSAIKLLATSSVVILDDYFFPIYCVKKKSNRNQVIQIWHAIGHLKRIGLSVKSNQTDVIRPHSNYDYAVVNSKEDIPYYAEAFDLHADQVLALGSPKVDKLFRLGNLNKTCNEKKKILYAPTYRTGGKDYSFDLIEEFIGRFEKYSLDYDIYISVHPYVTLPKISDASRIHIFQDGEYLESLLGSVDILVTDYSSIVLDYSYFEKPLVLYAPDYDNYVKKVGFYVDYRKYMGDLFVESFDDLEKHITDDRFYSDLNRVKELKNKTFDFVDGQNSRRLVEFILRNYG